MTLMNNDPQINKRDNKNGYIDYFLNFIYSIRPELFTTVYNIKYPYLFNRYGNNVNCNTTIFALMLFYAKSGDAVGSLGNQRNVIFDKLINTFIIPSINATKDITAHYINKSSAINKRYYGKIDYIKRGSSEKSNKPSVIINDEWLVENLDSKYLIQIYKYNKPIVEGLGLIDYLKKSKEDFRRVTQATIDSGPHPYELTSEHPSIAGWKLKEYEDKIDILEQFIKKSKSS